MGIKGTTDHRQTGRQTGRQAGRQAGRQTERQTNRQTDRQAGRQTDKQTDRIYCPFKKRKIVFCRQFQPSKQVSYNEKKNINNKGRQNCMTNSVTH